MVYNSSTQLNDLANGSKGITWVQVVPTLLGAVFGFASSYFMFNKQQKKALENQEAERKRLNEEKYKYFTTLIRRVPAVVDKAIGQYETHITKLENDKFYSEPPDFVNLTLLRRLCDGDNEKYLTAFISNYPFNNESRSTLKFMDLYKYLDFQYANIANSVDYSKGAQVEKMAALNNYLETFKIAFKECVRLSTNKVFVATEPIVSKMILDELRNYHNLPEEEKGMIPTAFLKFIDPLLKKIIALGIETPDDIIHELIVKLVDVKNATNKVEFLSLAEIADFKKIIQALRSGEMPKELI